MDSQIIALCFSSFGLRLRRIMNPPFHPPSVCPSANLSSFHLPHTETRQWGPHPSSVFPEILPSLGHSFHTGAPVSVFCTSFPHLFIISCTNTFYYQPLLLSSPLATCFPFGHTQPMSPLDWSSTYHLPLPTSSISSEYPAGQLPLPSEFVHLVPPLAQLSPGLVVPLTLDLVTRLRPLFLSYILQPRAVLSHPTF
jgi:hypothetical protein